jgi:hypothetical protein
MPAEGQFQPVSDFSFDVNRAERAQQVRFLVPLLADPEGRVWFLERLGCPCTADEARTAKPFHFVFPLRDLFTADYHACRSDSGREAEFIVYYNELFGLSADLGADTVWRTHHGGPIRHPAAPGRQGWHRASLAEHVSSAEVERLLNIRQWLDTEADAMLLLPRHIVTIDCKYRSSLLREQYERQRRMGELLGKRLRREFFFGLVVETPPDLKRARIQEPHVTWSENPAIRDWVVERVRQGTSLWAIVFLHFGVSAHQGRWMI